MKYVIPKYPKKRVIWAEKGVIGGSPRCNFPIVFDDTDHFHFICPECQRVALVSCIEVTDYAGYPEVHFFFTCPNCGVAGQRKVWAGTGRAE